MVLVRELVDLRGSDIRLQPDLRERIRRGRHEREHEKARDDEHGDAVQEPANDVQQHRVVSMIAAARAGRLEHRCPVRGRSGLVTGNAG
jgi:hypothetical protein